MADNQDIREQNRREEAAFQQRLAEEYQREDDRYSSANQAKDWAILITIGVLQFVWMFVVFLVEPGIR